MDIKESNLGPIDFEVRTHVKFGEGESRNTFKYITEMGYENPLIIIDKNILDTKLGQDVITPYNKRLNCIKYYFGEPTYSLLDAYRNRTENSDCVIGIGGGSVIDFAKGLALLSTNDKAAIEYRGFPREVNKPLPVIAVPTTAGTGSEVTYNAVFTDTNSKKKLGINTKENFPVLSILDPLFLLDCPFEVLVSTGMDGLIHSIESFSTTNANMITKPLSVIGFEYIMSSLSNISKKSRRRMFLHLLMAGSYYSGMALMNSGSGPTGALSYILGSNFNVSHGIAGATFLPHIIEHNEENGFDYRSFLKLRKNLSVVVYDLCNNFSINNNSLRQFGVNESNIKILLDATETLTAAFKQNPVPFDVDDAKTILERMI